MRFSRIATIVLCLSFCFKANAQIAEKHYTFKRITTEEGLSNNVVFDIHQDKGGYIWIATNNGLNRYDGYEVVSYFHSPKDSTSISSNVVRSIIEDQQEQLWIGTKNGLDRFDRTKQCFEKLINQDDFSISNKEVMSMHLGASGKLWMNASNNIVVFDPKTYEADPVYNSKNMLGVTLANQVVWASNDKGGIISYDISTKKLIRRENASGNSAVHFGNHTGSLWIPADFQPDLETNTFRRLPELPNKIKPRHLLELDTQRSWIGTNNGLFEYDSEKKSLSKIHLGKSTLTNQIRSIYKDKAGGVWVGTLGGVFHYDPYRKVFKHKDIIEESDDIIMGLHVNKGGVYANALGRGVFFKPNGSSEFKEIILPESLPRQGLFIWDMATVPESSFPLWMATNNGLICLDPKSSSFEEILIPLVENDENVSFSLLDTNEDFLWAATHRAIHKVNKKTRTLLGSFSLGEDINYPGIQKIIALDNYIFIATESEGLFKFHIPSQNISKLYLKSNKQEFASAIWDLYVSTNTLWIGANDGLYKLSTKDMLIEPVLEDNKVVFSIAEDESGTLWMGTDKGIKSFNPDNQKTKFYTTIDGLKNTEFNRKSVIKDDSNNLWFGGVNGITAFDPELIKKDNPNIPELHITAFRVATSDSTFSIPNVKSSIVLPWKHNTIELEYVGLNYTNPLQNKYRYIMEGHDPNWVEVDKPNTARYVKLPVGTYNFKVSAANSDNIWNTEGGSIEIRIKPPIWRTKTAYLLYVLSFLGLIWLFRRLKSYRNRIIEVEQEKEVIAKKVEKEFIVLNNKTKVYLKDLKYIRAAGNYLEFHSAEKVILDRNKLKLLEELLPPNFIRTHRSYIVNKNYIISANSASVFIKPDIETPLSRSFKGSLK
ncbi:two-component regulator propeller domain-containing protein [Winogradskyella sp. 3972H.M.0a.05]|uniref:ligand-binding sensor domain-containing protein n=1 Tax=Winogradskyella sp. 3972H.M.0a.05 TaxID=2950277 RepID=UPI003396CAC0